MTPDDSEIMRILESLVADNEALKRDNAELQGMLAETREDVLSFSGIRVWAEAVWPPPSAFLESQFDFVFPLKTCV